MIDIILKPGRDKSARQFHPWIFSGAIARVEGEVSPGGIIRLLDSNREFVAYGYYNRSSQIQVRLLEWNEERQIDDQWWRRKIESSIRRRELDRKTDNANCLRLIFSESDFLPGLIVDKYDEFLVIQILAAGIEAVRQTIVESLQDLLKPQGIYERSDVDVRMLEGLPQRKGIIFGEEPPDLITIDEGGLQFLVDIRNGQKGGFYIDQQENRRIVAKYAKGRHLLDAFCFTGGFSVHALKAGAETATLVDSSAESLALAEKNIKLNNLESANLEFVKGDVFTILRKFRDSGREFDMVILDPPKFAAAKGHIKKAMAAYKDINLLAMKLLRNDGILVSFSCSGAIDAQALKMAIFWASLDCGKQVQYLQDLTQGYDHPRLASFPEASYLKGFICRVVEG